jgi:anti-sigma factor RsiW
MTTVHPDDLLAAYALDALPDDERVAVEAHLVGCAQCRDWVARNGSTAGLLALAVEDAPSPAPDLRDRILAAANRTEQVRPGPRLVVAQAPRVRWRRLTGWLAAAALLVMTLGLGAWNYALQRDLRAAQAAPVLRGALAATSDAPNAEGTLVVGPGDSAALTVANLPPPRPGDVFEAWVIDSGGRPHPAGIFATSPDGHGVVGLTQPPRPGEVVAVTMEPAPGLAAPSGKILLKGTLD